jgi:hypothetical protein
MVSEQSAAGSDGHETGYRDDIYPVILLDQDEAREEIPVLNLRYTADPDDPYSSWAGIQTVVAPGLRDFTGKGYMEVLLRAEGVMVHLDCGSVGEDQVRGASWNGLLDTEDQHPENGAFDRPQEDTGFDGVSDDEEPGEGADPAGDNYWYSEADPMNYEKVNGMEGNQQFDTEDLNANGRLDVNEEFFRITIDTGSPTYLVQDLLDGWRLYRVSLDDPGITITGSPDWSRIESVRVWVSGPNARPDGLVQFGYIDVGWSR